MLFLSGSGNDVGTLGDCVGVEEGTVTSIVRAVPEEVDPVPLLEELVERSDEGTTATTAGSLGTTGADVVDGERLNGETNASRAASSVLITRSITEEPPDCEEGMEASAGVVGAGAWVSDDWLEDGSDGGVPTDSEDDASDEELVETDDDSEE